MVGIDLYGHKKKHLANILIIVFLSIFLLNNVSFFVTSNKDVSYAINAGAITMEVTTNRILYGENIDVRLPMASTTKAMTALVVIENSKLSDVVIIGKEAVGVEGSSIYLKEGERISVEELLYGLMLRSGNDSAVALANHVGGSLEKFVEMMNCRAAEMGLRNTHFENPHGLHHNNHYTSCYDLAVIACTAMKNSIFKKIVSTKNISFDGENPRFFSNKNKILFNYQGGNGIKTGYTKRAGRCLIASSSRNGMELVSVVLNCPPMFEKCSELMDRAYSEYEMKRLYSSGDSVKKVKIIGGTESEIDVIINKDIIIPIKKEGEEFKIDLEIPESIEAPFQKEKPIGKLNISVDERLLFSENVYIIKDIIKKKRGIWDYIKENMIP